MNRLQSMGNQLKILGILTILAVTVCYTLVYLYNEASHLKKDAVTDLETNLHTKSLFIDRWLDGRVGDLRTFANMKATRNLDYPGITDSFQYSKLNGNDFYSLSFIDTTGKVKASTEPLSAYENLDLSDRNYHKDAMLGREHISELLISRVLNDPTIFISVPVRGDDNKIIGLVLGSVKLDAIDNMLKPLDSEKNTETYLLDLKGRMLSESRYKQELIRRNMITETSRLELTVQSELFDAALAGRKIKESYRNYRGTEVFGSYAWVNDGQWLLVTEVEQSSLYTNLREHIFLQSIMTLVIIVITILVFVRMLQSRLAKPLYNLIEGARRLRKGDYETRIEFEAAPFIPNEYQTLRDTFNKMAATIRENMHELRQSEQRFKSLFDHHIDSVCSFDAEGHYVSANIACLQMSGYTLEELRGKNFREVIAPEANERAFEALARVLRGEPDEFEIDVITRTGSVRALYSCLIPIYESDRVTGAFCISKDVTQAKRAEAERLESQRQIASILESITDAFFALDSDWRFTYLNSEAKRMLSVYEKDLIGIRIWEAFPRVVDTKFYEAYRRAVEEQIPVHVLDYFEVLDAWYEVRAYPFQSGLSVYIRDVTEQIKLDKAFRENQEKFRFLVENSTDMISVHEKDGTYKFVSPSSLSLLGVHPEQLVGTDPYELFHPDDLATIRESHDKVNANEQVDTLTFRIRKQSGEYIWVESKSRRLISEIDGEVIVIVTRDITERKLAELRLQEANRKLQELSNLDGLTKLPNRRHFDEVLKQEWTNAANTGQPISLIMLDIDFFKLYNDHYGHLSGDDCLRRVSQVLKNELRRPADLAARFGGEEFAILLPNTEEAEAFETAERLREAIQSCSIPHAKSWVSDTVTVSLGVSTMRPGSGDKVLELIGSADKGLYQAKQNRNSVATHSQQR